jgi:hypothetical protein
MIKYSTSRNPLIKHCGIVNHSKPWGIIKTNNPHP